MYVSERNMTSEKERPDVKKIKSEGGENNLSVQKQTRNYRLSHFLFCTKGFQEIFSMQGLCLRYLLGSALLKVLLHAF